MPTTRLASLQLPGWAKSFDGESVSLGGWTFSRKKTSSRPGSGGMGSSGSPSTARAIASALVAGSRRYSFYSQDMHLIAESDLTAAPHPGIAEEYIWFDGRPVAQVDATGEVR